jgi:pimeloyl-ACP methyl ester carboxylesterase
VALGAGARAAVRATPLLVRATAQVELAAARCVAEGEGGSVGSGYQVDGGRGDIGAAAGGFIGPGHRPADVLSGLGCEEPDGGGRGGEVVDGIGVGCWQEGAGGAHAHYDGIVAFSQTDFTEDLKKITVPVLVMHGDDEQIVPYADSGPLSAQLLPNGTLKTYNGFPHGMPTTQAQTINADLLAFIRS